MDQLRVGFVPCDAGATDSAGAPMRPMTARALPSRRHATPAFVRRSETTLARHRGVSPATARADRVAKRTLYREENVAEYWIVDLDSRTIERSTPLDSRVEVLADQIEWRPQGTESPLVIDLPGYFARLLDK